jgi:hypothetical protein
MASEYDDRDVERLLRATLRDEADRLHPAGDGLARIRERVAGRRRWRTWLTPLVALAGAAAVITAVVAAPSYLTGSGSKGRQVQPGGQPAPASPAPTSPPPTTPTPTRAPQGSLGTPYGGDDNLRDMLTVWPYPSRRIGFERADAEAQTYPNLSRPDLTAVDFVASFVGDKQGLSARRYDAYPPGVRMLVVRDTPSGEVPVSLVFLVRVRFGNDAPYVVVGASRAGITKQDSLTISRPPAVRGTAAFRVSGLARGNQGPGDRTVIVQLREPGSTEVLAQQAAPVRFGGFPMRTWTADLTPLQALRSTGVVAAWTSDADGMVQEFVAAPTAP